jgi:hypothetical protein
MSTLAPRTRLLLDQARQQAAPGPEELARARSRVMAGLTAPSTARVLPLVALSWLRLVGVGTVVTLAGVGAWQVVAGRAPDGHPPAQAEALVCPPTPSCAPAQAWWPPPARQAPARCAAPAPVPQCQSTGSAAAAPRQRGANSATLYSVPQEESNRLEVELGLLLDARVALDEGRPLDALGHVQRHEQLFERSAFEEERLALMVLSYCELGRTELAQPRLQRLLELAPETSYLPRVQAACPGVPVSGAPGEHEDE